jgi:hypothetical protein
VSVGAIAAGGAAASLGGSLLSSNAAQSAAQTQANAADLASNNALAEYQQTEKNLSPFLNAGTTGLGSLETILGLPGGSGVNPLAANGINSLAYTPSSTISGVLNNPTFAPTQAQLEATPGYQFDLNQGLQATQNSNAAAGLGISGPALKGAANYATGLANNTLTTQQGIFQNNYQNALTANSQGQGIFQGNLGNVINPVSSLTNLGENAGATVGQQGIQAIGNANSLAVGGANAIAGGTVGSANAISGGLTGASNAGLNSLLYSQILNPNSSGAQDSGAWD